MSAWTVELVERQIVNKRDWALCPDGVVRVNLDVAAKVCAEEYVRQTNEAGEVCAAVIFAPGDKKLRVAIYPKTLELPKPQWSKRCGAREDALVAVQQERIQHPARYVRGMEVECGGFVVESWEPWDFLRQGWYPCWTVEEIVGAHVDYGSGGADIEFHRQNAKERGLKNLKAGAEKRKVAQIAAFQRWRERYPKYSKEWIQGEIVKEHAKEHPRTRGWGIKTVETNTEECV